MFLRDGYAQDQRAPALRCWLDQPEPSRLPLEVNMELSNIVLQAISTVGFPVVVSIALFWKMNKQDEDHKSEMLKVTEAINNNTIALQKLIDKFES